MNYRKNIQRPARQISFLTRFLRWVQRLFSKQQPVRSPQPAPVVPYRLPAIPKETHGGSGFGNPLSPRSRVGRWWIPPDERAEPSTMAPMKHRNEHRRLMQRVARIA